MRKITLSLIGLASLLSGQQITDTRNAEIRGGGGDGKCTIEVDVDDIAEVEVGGNRAQIRTLAGSPARIVRFVCNQAMPNNPNDFRFEGVDGRGRQTLVRQPGRGPAVIRIEDSKGGREGYTFDIFWRGGSGGGVLNNDGGGFGGRPGGGGWGANNGGGRGNNNGGVGTSNNNGAWNRELNFRGRGEGDFRSGRGNTDRLSDCRVSINRRGDVEVRFETDRSTSLVLDGQVQRIDRGRVYARMNGNGVAGDMVIDFDERDRVSNISMSGTGRDRFDLRWRN